MLGGDLNRHVGSSGDGYEGVHGGYGFDPTHVDGERILEFGDAMEMIGCNTHFKRNEQKLVTYESKSDDACLCAYVYV